MVGEFFTAQTGLGGLLVRYASNFRTAEMFVPIFVLVALGYGLTALVAALQERLAPWKETERDLGRENRPALSEERSMTTMITAGTVVTANGRMEVWQPGYMIVRDSRIAEAGPGPGPDGDFDERIDARSSIVMPGLVNGHSHSPSNLLKGTWSRLPLEIWRQYIRAGWREYSDEAIYVSAQLGIVEMIRTGCTSVMDHFYTGSPLPHMGALNAVAAMADAGMRGGLASTLSDRQYETTVGIDTKNLSAAARQEVERISRLEGTQSLEDFVKFAETVRSRTHLVLPIVGPSAPHRCTQEQLRRARRRRSTSIPWCTCTSARRRGSSCRGNFCSVSARSVISTRSAS